MYKNEPKMAERWSKETPKGKNLPERVSDKQKPKSKVFKLFKKHKPKKK